MSDGMEREVLNCIGALCATPIVQLRKPMKSLRSSTKLILREVDPANKTDILIWSRLSGYDVSGIDDQSIDRGKS